MAARVKKPTIQIELTAEQREQVRRATGKATATQRLTPEELEERIAPIGGGIGPSPGPGPGPVG